jgi:hypothetical protein
MGSTSGVSSRFQTNTFLTYGTANGESRTKETLAEKNIKRHMENKK